VKDGEEGELIPSHVFLRREKEEESHFGGRGEREDRPEGASSFIVDHSAQRLGKKKKKKKNREEKEDMLGLLLFLTISPQGKMRKGKAARSLEDARGKRKRKRKGIGGSDTPGARGGEKYPKKRKKKKKRV